VDKKQLKRYKSAFRFGTPVRYEKMLTREYGKDDFGDGTEFGTRVIKEWKQTQVSTRTGIVVGWRWLSNGIGNYDSENGYYYTITESVFAIEVKRGMMNQVDLVLPESAYMFDFITPLASHYLILLLSLTASPLCPIKIKNSYPTK
jgi:hypothetical protein